MTPLDLNFKMPPEWMEHTRTFIQWPVKESLCWPENYFEVCAGYAGIANAIAEFEPVAMLVNQDSKKDAAKLCGPKVELWDIAHSDAWIRDNGPTFVINDKGQIAGVNWVFNAWGEKYAPWDLDNQVTPQLLQRMGITRFDAPIVLEGGSIHVDGEGTLLTTEECLLNKTRNPKLKREEVFEQLKKYLGIEKIIWLPKGLEGDETDGHIDNVATFARPGVVIIQTCSDPQDANYQITQDNMSILNETTDARGRKLKIITIPQPKATYYKDSRLTLSYLNFYFVNGGIILPTFGGEHSENDKVAMEKLKKAFPDRKVVAVDGMPLVKEGGNVHCITQQMPVGDPASW